MGEKRLGKYAVAVDPVKRNTDGQGCRFAAHGRTGIILIINE
jgi:hypothetical protein